MAANDPLLFGVWIGVRPQNFYRYRDFVVDPNDTDSPPPLAPQQRP